jgi:basic membrane protein A
MLACIRQSNTRSGTIMILTRLLFVLLWVSSVLAFSACTPQPTDCAEEDVFCVGLVTAYEGVEDHGLNQAAWEALQNVVSQAKITRLDHIDSVDARDWQKNILFFADNGYDVIVTVGDSLAETTVAVAAEYPSIFFIGIDQEVEAGFNNVATITFADDQAGFIAGTLAAMVSSAGKVGAICETSGIDIVWQYCEGFRAGAKYEDEEVEVTVLYRENGERDKTFNDPEWGGKNMLSVVNKGVDTMTAFGGNTAKGAFLAAAEKGISIIGSEGDLYYQLPDVQEVLVTSILNDPGPALSSLVIGALQGEVTPGPQEGEISLAPFRRDLLTAAEIQSNLEDVLQKIESGEIEMNIPERKYQSCFLMKPSYILYRLAQCINELYTRKVLPF